MLVAKNQQAADLIENYVVNDGHRLIFLASEYDSIQLDDIIYVS